MRITAPMLALAALLLVPGSSRAASQEELEARIASMEAELQQLRELAAEVRSMKQTEAERSRRQEILTAEVRGMREDAALPPKPEAREGRHGMGPAASKVYRTERGVSLAGYGQGWYTAFVDDEGPKDRDTFDLVRNVLYFGYRFSEDLVLNTEIEWEHAGTGGGGSVSVEFAQLDFMVRETFNLRAGLLLVPVGFVNEIHEPLFYLGNQRPEVERRIIPSTWREGGVGIFGRLGERFEYRAYVMNGLRGSAFTSAGIRGGRQAGSGALAEGGSVVLRGDYQASDALTLGASVYTGKQGQSEDFVVDAAGNTLRPRADLTLVEAHAEYRRRGWKARALCAMTRLGDAQILSAAQALKKAGPVAERMRGAYAELAYDLFHRRRRGDDQHLDLFFRYEAWDTQDRVPLGYTRDASRDEQVRTWGLQFRPHADVALKLDYRNFGTGAGRRADELNLGFGWVF